MRKLFSFIYRIIFPVLLIVLWVLLYKEGLPQKFDWAQWTLMGILTFAGLFATALTWYIECGNKKPAKYQCCNCDEMFDAEDVLIGEDMVICLSLIHI